jgi:peptidoglycan LD-endopeptidase CwlK
VPKLPKQRKGKLTVAVSTVPVDLPSAAAPSDPFRLIKLEGCRDDLREKMARVLTAMRALGWPMVVTDGLRTLAQQQQKWAQGRTEPGPIVTKADGVHTLSNHQSGKACDCAFYVAGSPSWDARLPWATYGACLKAVGLKWGGDWSIAHEGLHDLPHAELP